MCYFIKKGENYAVTKITRAQRDYFTDVCQNCHEYGAEPGQGICRCEPKSISAGSNSLFLRNQGYCVDENVIMTDEDCQMWNRNFIEVIDTEERNSYIFSKGSMYPSYQLEPSISYRNSTTGEWQFFNLSGNVLVLQNDSDPGNLQIKVTQVSPSLTKFKGYVMKLGLKRKRLYGKTEKSCLLFKAKGEVRFALNCSVPTTTPVSTTTGIPTTTTATPSNTTVTPTRNDSTTTTGTPTKIDKSLTIVVIVIGGAVLILFLICAVVLLYRYRYMCGLRGRQERNPEINLDGNELPFIFELE